jgi:hypothetical protein
VSPTDSENISEHLRTSPEMEELIAQHEAKERYSQKPDFIITPENQNAHEENLHQLSLISDPKELDHFYLQVKGVDIQKIPTEEDKRRFKGFEEDCSGLIDDGWLSPDADHDEKQKFFNIHEYVLWLCDNNDEDLTFSQILKKFHDPNERWIAQFFMERARDRGEIRIRNDRSPKYFKSPVLKEECEDLVKLDLASPDIWENRFKHSEEEAVKGFKPNEYEVLSSLRDDVFNDCIQYGKKYTAEGLADLIYKEDDDPNRIFEKAAYFIRKFVERCEVQVCSA